ncbi:MAG: AAA family ATPase [Planctomycetaceae bacterium]
MLTARSTTANRTPPSSQHSARFCSESRSSCEFSVSPFTTSPLWKARILSTSLENRCEAPGCCDQRSNRAGKSSLLDALCLALFDATPRLQQVGRLAELTDGERQSDPRMLLRRGAGEGFAEVAFVGVDQQEWTARWHVWRSHKRPDGSLQQVEMTLFRGHIPPGGQGTPEASGKKTEVREAILEKVGLRFDQFTRAVLLAQNDFARFLTADDKQRGDSSALTGTERFEAISQAVYRRCDEERRAIGSLEAKLEGSQPLTNDARAEAEAAQRAAADTVARLETELTRRQDVAKWFTELRRLTGDLAKANDDLRRAKDAMPRPIVERTWN